MGELVQLKVIGLSYSQTQSGAYALILGQIDGHIRIPIVIGAAETQAIAMRLEGLTAPRPLTHDLMANMARAFGIVLQKVVIYKFEDGIFSSEMTFIDSDREVTIDSRTSDAVAMAIRFGAPIYTTRSIMEETGFVMEIRDEASTLDVTESDTMATATEPLRPDLEKYSVEELNKALTRFIESEEYEQAARVSEILKRKHGGVDDSTESKKS